MIALYSRVSTEIQKENHSIGEQQDMMQKYCEAMKWKPFDFYTDAGFSGAKLDRPALQKLIRDIKAGMVDKVIVYKLDRLSRSQKDMLYLIEDVFQANNCDFVSMSENLDTSSPFGKAMTGILAVFAQLEREQIKDRMAMGRVARAKDGRLVGKPGYGYEYIDGELVVNETQRHNVIMAFQLLLAGKSINAITQQMRRADPSLKWDDKCVRRMLTRKSYIGYVSCGKEWYKANHEHIIDDETFNKAQIIMEYRKETYLRLKRRVGKATSYLGGMLFCKRCGEKYGKQTRKSHNLYKCRSMIYSTADCNNLIWRMDELDELVFDQIRQLTLEDIKVEPVQTDKDELETALSAVEKKIERLVELYTVGSMPIDILQRKIKTLNSQKMALEQQIEDIPAPIDADEIIETVNSFDKVLKHGDFDEIRAIITALIDKIEIDGENITIFWAFS